jgi:hypothetical protein
MRPDCGKTPERARDIGREGARRDAYGRPREDARTAATSASASGRPVPAEYRPDGPAHLRFAVRSAPPGRGRAKIPARQPPAPLKPLVHRTALI